MLKRSWTGLSSGILGLLLCACGSEETFYNFDTYIRDSVQKHVGKEGEKEKHQSVAPRREPPVGAPKAPPPLTEPVAARANIRFQNQIVHWEKADLKSCDLSKMQSDTRAAEVEFEREVPTQARMVVRLPNLEASSLEKGQVVRSTGVLTLQLPLQVIGPGFRCEFQSQKLGGLLNVSFVCVPPPRISDPPSSPEGLLGDLSCPFMWR